MYIVIWENRHPYSKDITQHWEMFVSKKQAEKRFDVLDDIDFVKHIQLLEVTSVLG